jgi:hypothetical protein
MGWCNFKFLIGMREYRYMQVSSFHELNALNRHAPNPRVLHYDGPIQARPLRSSGKKRELHHSNGTSYNMQSPYNQLLTGHYVSSLYTG